MLVHLANRSCNCCGKWIDNSIIDLPITEIKLTHFPVECACGYFYEAVHYSVSFTKWRLAKDFLETRIVTLEESISKEQELEVILEFEVQLEKAQKKLSSLSIPVPDVMWEEKDSVH